jgi:hypothetical protein
METTPLASNPFGLMMNPQAILDAVERSERLGGLQRRICRPLDKPLIPHADAGKDDLDADDGDNLPDDFGSGAEASAEV